MIWNTPSTIAQLAMNTSSTSAVSPGHMKVNSPTRMPSTPISASHQRDPSCRP